MSKNSKAKNGGGFIGGFIILIIGIVILWNNEGRVVKMQNVINEALKNYVDVSSKKIDKKNEGKLIATTGKIVLGDNDRVRDSKFGISMDAVKLKRVVEMYQWVEDCEEDDEGTQDCSYDKDWSEKIIDSSNFSKLGYNNPKSMKLESDEYVLSNDVKVGEFVLPERMIENLSYNKEFNNEKLSEKYHNTVSDYVINEKYITNSKDVEHPEVGDLRISYKYASGGEVSIMGVQKEDTLVAYTGKKGKSILNIKRGGYTGKEILVGMTNSNNSSKWFKRIIGLLVVMGGVASLFSPLQSLTNKIPVIGSIVNFSASLFAVVIGTAISLLVVSIAWFRFRPILSIVLIVIIAVLIYILKFKSEKNNGSK